jgi:hypothetical protein
MTRVTYLLILIPALVPACSGETAGRAGTFVVDTLASGAVRVSNTGTPAWGKAGGWVAVEELRLGTVSGGGPEQFGAISGLAVDAAGYLYVLEYQAQEVRVFGPDGAFSHAFGGKGQGPGEFLGADGLLFDSQGNLVVREQINNRFSAFDVCGAFRWTRPQGFFSRKFPWQAAFVQGYGFVDWGTLRPFEPGASGQATVSSIPISFGEAFESQDTFPPVESRLETVRGRWTPRPFAERLHLFLDRQGFVWFVHGRDYTVYRRTLGGDTVSLFTLPVEPELVTAQERDGFVVHWRQWGVTREDVPRTKPVVLGIAGDNAGHILVFPHTREVAEGTAFDLFTEAGVYQGRVHLPLKLVLLNTQVVVRGGALYGVVRDTLDVPYVVRLRLEGMPVSEAGSEGPTAAHCSWQLGRPEATHLTLPG